MRNPVARYNHNRPAIHAERSKSDLNTKGEGLLDYYAENAQDVSQRVYEWGAYFGVVPRDISAEEHPVVGMTPDYSGILPLSPDDSAIVPMTPSRIITGSLEADWSETSKKELEDFMDSLLPRK